MKKYTWITYLVIAVIIIAGVGAWFSRDTSSETGFRVGLISILSGDYAAVGENMKNGVVLANELYNAAHPDAQVTLLIQDDGFNGGKGASAYQKLVAADHIDALINVSTPTIDSIYATVSKTDMPVIQMGEQGREPAADNVFGIFPNSIASEYDYGVYMKNRGVKEMVIVYMNNDAMIRFVESFKKGFAGKTTDFMIDPSEKDFRTHALKVSALHSETIGMFMFPQQGAQFLKEFLKIDKSKPQFFFDANFQSGKADYERILGGLGMLDGALFGTINMKTDDAFKVAYKKRFGTEPGFLADMGYDSFNVLVTAHAKDNATWLKNIQNIKFDGASGSTQFDATGNRQPETKIVTLKGGEMVDVVVQ